MFVWRGKSELCVKMEWIKCVWRWVDVEGEKVTTVGNMEEFKAVGRRKKIHLYIANNITRQEEYVGRVGIRPR